MRLTKQLAPLVGDGRIGSTHLSLYVALLQCREGQGGAEAFFIRRQEMMRLARIQGRATYFKCLKELDGWGYIEYRPSRDRDGRCKVRLG